MTKFIAVEFLEAYTPYAKGEIAGFEIEIADDLIKRKVAKEYESVDESPKKKK